MLLGRTIRNLTKHLLKSPFPEICFFEVVMLGSRDYMRTEMAEPTEHFEGGTLVMLMLLVMHRNKTLLLLNVDSCTSAAFF
jgi:hypothetical protein